MIRILEGEQAWTWLEEHGQVSDDSLRETVQGITQEVQSRGDEALLEFAKRFGDSEVLELSQAELKSRADSLDSQTKEILQRAASRIRSFADSIVSSLKPVNWQGEGYEAGMKYVPVERVGCYVPGGRYPLPSTALMTAITSRAAGVSKVFMTCPDPHPAVLYAAELSGVDRFYCVGGAQAVAAFCYGTDTIEPVDMIVGPGNAFVTEAKKQLQGLVGIDMLAGPSEVAIIADETANPKWVALDLLAQAEHDPLAKVCLITASREFAQSVQQALADNQDQKPDFISESLDIGALLVLESQAECIKASETFAAEHLQVYSKDSGFCEALRQYGALFKGEGTPVALGDYGAGPNHTLPTGKAARFSSGLSPLTFLRSQTWLEAGPEAKQLLQDTVAFAKLEGLHLHAASARARL